MRIAVLLVALALPLLAVSCSQTVSRMSGPDAIATFNASPGDTIIYRGVDDSYYYLDLFQRRSVTRFKVSRSEIILPESARVGDIVSSISLRTPNP